MFLNTQAVPSFDLYVRNIVAPALNGQLLFASVPVTGLSLGMMTIQVSADCIAQLLDNGNPITAPYVLKANMIWSVASRYVPNNSSITLAITAGTANVDSSYRAGFHAEDLWNREHKFYNVA